MPCACQAAELPARFLEYPASERQDQAGLLGNRDELRWRHKAALGMIPPHQRLQSDDPSGGKLHLRLVVCLDLAAVERAAQLIRDGHAPLEIAVEIVAVEADAIAPILLGAVERQIGLRHHRVRPCDIGGIARDPDAGGDACLAAFDQIGSGDDGSDLDRKRAGRGQIRGVGLQQRELVAAQPRHQILLAHRPLDARRHLAKQHVAQRMTERVVDVLEMVEIEIEHGEWRRAAGGIRKGLLEPRHESPAIGHPRQRVGLRELGDLGVGPAQIVGMAGHAPEIDHDADGDDQPGAEDDAGAVVASGQRPVRHRRRHQRQPGLAPRLKIARPARSGVERASRRRLERLLAQTRVVDIDRQGLRRAVRIEKEQVDALRRGRCVEHALDQPGGGDRAVDEADEVAAALVQRVVRQSLAVDRQQEYEPGLGAGGGDQRRNRKRAEPVAIAGPLELRPDRGIGAQVEAVERGCLRHRRIAHGKILVMRRRWVEAAVGRTALDAVAGASLARSGQLERGALVAPDPRQPRRESGRRNCIAGAPGRTPRTRRARRCLRSRTRPAGPSAW